MKRPNPTLKEIEQWSNELPTIEDLKQVFGFDISKPYYFVRMEGKWHIGKENSYIDVKNLAGKPDNIQCFADGDNINKRLVGKRDSESLLLNTVRIQALQRESDNLDKLLCKIGLRKDSIEFMWEKSPQEIYEDQIKEYKKLHNINDWAEKTFVFIYLSAFTISLVLIYLNTHKTINLVDTSQIQDFNEGVINKLNSEYQKLSFNKKILFLRRTGLSTVLDSKSNLENKSLNYFIARYFNNKDFKNNNEQKTLFLKNLLNEIRGSSKSTDLF